VRRIALNLLFLVPGETGGMEIHARRLIAALATARPDIEWLAIVSREAADLDLGPNVRLLRTSVSARSRPRRILAEQTLLPRLVRRYGAELLHSLGASAPVRATGVQVVTIHDVIYARAPQAHTPVARTARRVIVPAAARAADRVITVSGAARDDIVAELGVPTDRIDVVHNGPGLPRSPTSPVCEVRERFGLGTAPFVLSASGRRPHKNLTRLLEAMARVNAGDEPLLVLPGYPTAFEDDLVQRARVLRIDHRVRILSWVSDADLNGLYQAAAVFAFPSLAEGFGMPVLEAMSRDLPVACANVPALREVAGDAARYFNPLEVNDIASAINTLLDDCIARETLIAAGRKRAQCFTWERAARGTLESYERALAQKLA